MNEIKENMFSLDKTQAVDGYLWFVVNIVSSKELFIKDYLENKIKFKNCEFKFKIPQKKMMIRRRGEYTEELKVIFSGYIFILVNPEHNIQELLYEIESCRFKDIGIIKILKDSHTGMPLVVKKKEVEWLKSLMNKDDVVEYTFGFKIGDEVRIISGPFQNQITKIIKIDLRKFKIKVKLSFLGEQTVDFAFNYIEAVN